MHAVVCEDPSRQWPVGSVVEGTNEIAQLRSRQVALLPCDVELPRLALVGYVQQHYGVGWRFNGNAGERGCPMALHVKPPCCFVYWAARIQPEDPQGWRAALRLVHSAERHHGVGSGLVQLEYLRETPALDSRGGYTVFGKSRLESTADGLLFVDLYSVSSGCLVKWLALTQHRVDYQW